MIYQGNKIFQADTEGFLFEDKYCNKIVIISNDELIFSYCNKITISWCVR